MFSFDNISFLYFLTLSGTYNVSLTKENVQALLTMLSSDNQTKVFNKGLFGNQFIFSQDPL